VTVRQNYIHESNLQAQNPVSDSGNELSVWKHCSKPIIRRVLKAAFLMLTIWQRQWNF